MTEDVSRRKLLSLLGFGAALGFTLSAAVEPLEAEAQTVAQAEPATPATPPGSPAPSHGINGGRNRRTSRRHTRHERRTRAHR